MALIPGSHAQLSQLTALPHNFGRVLDAQLPSQNKSSEDLDKQLLTDFNQQLSGLKYDPKDKDRRPPHPCDSYGKDGGPRRPRTTYDDRFVINHYAVSQERPACSPSQPPPTNQSLHTPSCLAMSYFAHARAK